MNKELDIGQRVRFNTDSRWEVSDSNPIHCFGTIQESPDGWIWLMLITYLNETIMEKIKFGRRR